MEHRPRTHQLLNALLIQLGFFLLALQLQARDTDTQRRKKCTHTLTQFANRANATITSVERTATPTKLHNRADIRLPRQRRHAHTRASCAFMMTLTSLHSACCVFRALLARIKLSSASFFSRSLAS